MPRGERSPNLEPVLWPGYLPSVSHKAEQSKVVIGRTRGWVSVQGRGQNSVVNLALNRRDEQYLSDDAAP